MRVRYLLHARNSSRTVGGGGSLAKSNMRIRKPVSPRRAGLRSSNGSVPAEGPKVDGNVLQPGADEHLLNEGSTMNTSEEKFSAVGLKDLLSGEQITLEVTEFQQPSRPRNGRPRRLSFDSVLSSETTQNVVPASQVADLALGNQKDAVSVDIVAEPHTPPSGVDVGSSVPKEIEGGSTLNGLLLSSALEVCNGAADDSEPVKSGKRPRGRPRRTSVSAPDVVEPASTGKKPRGRPKKSSLAPAEPSMRTPEGGIIEVPRKRGRPKRTQSSVASLKEKSELAEGVQEGLEESTLGKSDEPPLKKLHRRDSEEQLDKIDSEKIEERVIINISEHDNTFVSEASPPETLTALGKPGRPGKLPVVSSKGKITHAGGRLEADDNVVIFEPVTATNKDTVASGQTLGKRPRGRPRKLEIISSENLGATSASVIPNADIPSSSDFGFQSIVDVYKSTTLPTGSSGSPVAAPSDQIRVEVRVNARGTLLEVSDVARPFTSSPVSQVDDDARKELDLRDNLITPEQPAKRRPGRPKKARTSEPTSPRPRGRPISNQAELTSPRPRGRPRSNQESKVVSQLDGEIVADENGTEWKKDECLSNKQVSDVELQSGNHAGGRQLSGEVSGDAMKSSTPGTPKQHPTTLEQTGASRRVGRPRKALQGNGGLENSTDSVQRQHGLGSRLLRTTTRDARQVKPAAKRGRPRKEVGNTVSHGGKRRPSENAHSRYTSHVVLDGVKFSVGDDVYVRKEGYASPELELEVEECQVCGETGESTMIECDKCLGGFHLTCIDPPLDAVPEGSWVCPFCVSGSKPPVQPRGDEEKRRSAREMLLLGELWAARIEKIWQESDGTYWFSGRWFLIPEDTSTGRQEHTGSRELYRSSKCDDNEMVSILRHCYVMNPAEFKMSTAEGDDVFFCAYDYSERWSRFKRIDYDNDFLEDPDIEDETYDPSDGSGDESDGSKGTNRVVKSSRKLTRGKSSRAANKRGSFSGGIEQVGAKTVNDRPKRAPQTEFEKANAALMLSAVPPALPCRDSERAEIASFLKDSLQAGEQCLGNCLYISGVPGTGKTATVREVVKELERKVDAGELPAFRFVEVNGLRLPSPEHLYTVLHDALTGQHLGWKKALELLDDRFSGSKNSKSSDIRPCVLIVDELDVLVNRNQSVLYNVFDWPCRPLSRLVVIGIANTMDLPERMLPRISSRMGLKRVSFSPYTHQQLEEILASRLEGVHIFDKQAAEFASRKVAAVSGDIRRALELCRRAVEVAEARLSENVCASSQGNEMGVTSGSEAAQCPGLVTMGDVDAAIKLLFEAPQVQMMQKSSKLSKVFLTAMVCEQRRTSMVETTFEKVVAVCSELCANNGEEVPDTDTLLGIGCKLGSSRLLLCESGDRRKLQKIQLNLPSDDISFALKDDSEIPWLAKYL